jgi:2-dehydro-3-deoxyphosphogluconate aldolase/(4S)-4-hydroxy-2-oxoglutarate aldolase
MSRVEEFGILPVVELADLKQAEPLFEALCDGGLAAAEITHLVAAYPTGFIGAGTVRSLEDAARVIDAGARFVVCPGTDPEIVAFCCQQGVLVMPGVCTPTEIQMALRAGASLLKFFPAEPSGGVSFLKALAGPFGEVRFVPTGGISAANLGSYLTLKQVAACGGSWMVTKALVADGDFEKIRELTAEAVRVVANARGDG